MKWIAAMFFSAATIWAVYMLSVSGDGRWLMTIVGAPIMGAILFTVLRSVEPQKKKPSQPITFAAFMEFIGFGSRR